MNYIKLIFLSYLLLSGFMGNSMNRGPLNKDCYVVYEMDSVRITVENYMGHLLYQSVIRTYVNDYPVDSSEYTPEAVGGYMGISSGVKLACHMIFTKHGDYNGRTLIVNAAGHIESIIGGDNFIDAESNLLFTTWESDDAGFAVYDLNRDSVIMAKYRILHRPESFHKVENEYYALCYDNTKDANVIRQFFLLTREYGRAENRNVKINDSNNLKRITIYPEGCYYYSN